MQAHSVPSQPQTLLEPALRLLVLVPVVAFLAGVVDVAAAASHQAVQHMSAQFQPGAYAAQPAQLEARRAPGDCVGTHPQAS